MMYHYVNGIHQSTALWYLMRAPKDLFMLIYFKMTGKSKKRYFDNRHIINEIRVQASKRFTQKEIENYRANVKLAYKITPRCIKIRVKFDKKILQTDYEGYQESCKVVSTLKSLDLKYKRGYCYFELFEKCEPIKELKCTDTAIAIGSDLDGLKMWEFYKYPHMMVVGPSGMGKTTFINYLMLQLLEHKTELWCIDGKGIDFSHMSILFEKYACCLLSAERNSALNILNECKELVQSRYKRMKELHVKNYVKAGFKPVFLFIEEYATIVEFFDKKEKEVVFDVISYLVRMARASGVELVFVMQRGDTTFLKGETRENISCRVVLGSAGEDSYKMAFGTDDIIGLEQGQAWCKIGNQRDFITIPLYEEIEGVDIDETT